MNCSWCKKSINKDEYISGGGGVFCSEVCLLRFYKDEFPNLGGDAITESDIRAIEQATGEERSRLHSAVMLKFMNRIGSSNFMQYLKDTAK